MVPGREPAARCGVRSLHADAPPAHRRRLMTKILPGRLALLLVTSAWLACGGSGRSPLSPDSLTARAPEAIAAGTAFVLVSGEDGRPVVDAKMVLAGETYSADGAGRVVISGRRRTAACWTSWRPDSWTARPSCGGGEGHASSSGRAVRKAASTSRTRPRSSTPRPPPNPGRTVRPPCTERRRPRPRPWWSSRTSSASTTTRKKPTRTRSPS
jgi:hypothetical protein